MLSGLSFRSGIKEDFELLELIPDAEVERKTALRQSISERIDDLVEANAKRRRLRAAALAHGGSWRDIILFVNTVLSPLFGGTSITIGRCGCRCLSF